MKSDTLLFIDKPSGITSFGIVRKLRKILNTRKIGHGGTLDPMATGLLVIGIGTGTKLLTKVIGSNKTYEATVQFGIKTSTGDADGEVVAENSNAVVAEKHLATQLQSMIGSMILEVSPYSAVKQGGVPLYRKVHRGEKYIIPKREMVIYGAQLISFDSKKQSANIIFKVASGTYVRSLAEELAIRLDTFAHLSALRRTAIGEHGISGAVTLQDLES
jgi:tRNA pseudouridine55 synthase